MCFLGCWLHIFTQENEGYSGADLTAIFLPTVKSFEMSVHVQVAYYKDLIRSDPSQEFL